MMRFVILCLLLHSLLGSLDLALAGVSSSKNMVKKEAGTQLVSIQQLHQLLMQELQDRIDSQHVTLNVQVLFPKKPIEVTAGKLDLRVEKDRFGNLTGRRAFRVQVIIDSHPLKTVSVVAAVTARADVMTPVRWIKLHDVLQAKDLVKTTVNLRTMNQDVLIHAGDIVGKQATRSLPPHQPLRTSYLTDPPLVHKGDRVMIEVRRGGLFVQTLGVAKASGQSGELIPVTNQTSGREVLATILSTGVVEVRF